MANPNPPRYQKQAKVSLGDNKAIAALTFATTVNGKLELGAVFHIPVRQEGGKTFFKAIACSVEITADQRSDIVKMFGGTMLQ